MAMATTPWTETPVVDNTFDEVNSAISGSKVVWQDYRNKTSGCPSAQNCLAADIYMRDLGAGAEQQLTTTANGLDPDISGSKVVWRDWDTGKIVVYDLTDSTRFDASTIGGTVQQVTPAISGNRVVWADYRNSSDYGDIYMRDLAAGADVAVAPGDPAPVKPRRDKRNPDIDGSIVVWEDWRNAFQDAQGWWHNPDIYAKDVVSGTVYPVCTNTDDQYSPVVSGTRVFWQDYRNGNWDIYMKDLAAGVETRLTTNTLHQSWPSADGDFVVFKDTRDGDEDIYLKRISTGVEQPVNTDPAGNGAAAQKISVISGTTIAWIDKRAGNWDIYSARDTAPPQILSTSPTGPLAATAATIQATYADSGMAVNPATVAVTLDLTPLTGCSISDSALSCPVAGLSPGAHSFTVSLADLDGNATSATTSFTVDTTGPVISGVAPSGWLTSPDTTLSAVYADAGTGIDAAAVHLLLDGVAAGPCNWDQAAISCAATGLADGPHTIAVGVADNAGNISSATAAFQVDSRVDSTLLSLTPVDPGGVQISLAYADAGSGIDLSQVAVLMDGTAITGCQVAAAQTGCAVTGLSYGPHTVVASVADLAGNLRLDSGSFFTDDLIHPVVTAGGPQGTITSGGATITAFFTDASPSSGVDAGSASMMIDGAAMGSCTASAASISCDVDNLGDGDHDVSVTVSDNSGLQGGATWSFTVDGAIPFITDLQPASGARTNNPRLLISTGYAANGRGIDVASIRVYLDGTDVTDLSLVAPASITYQPPEAAPLADGLHTARFVIADTFGAVADRNWSFTVTSPRIAVSFSRSYWGSYSDFVQRRLAVDYQVQATGTGAVNQMRLDTAFASGRVMLGTPLPLELGSLPPDGKLVFTLTYIVPAGVTAFQADNHTSFRDDGGNLYGFGGYGPTGPAACVADCDASRGS
ncbi:MAG: hypothetical protein ACYC6B_04610 [Thermoleophilia bacterium]